MAILAQGSLMQGARGLLAGVVFRTIGNKTIVSNRPSFPRSRLKKQSPAQKLTRSNFRKASAYAQAAMLNAEKKQYYQRKAREMDLPNAYTAAITDYMRNVKIQSIDTSHYTGKAGGRIVIDAHRKDFEVSEVNVTIGMKSGHAVETGKATRNSSGKWVYKCTTNTSIDPKELIIVAGAMDQFGKTLHARYVPGEKLLGIKGRSLSKDITVPEGMMEG